MTNVMHQTDIIEITDRFQQHIPNAFRAMKQNDKLKNGGKYEEINSVNKYTSKHFVTNRLEFSTLYHIFLYHVV